MNTTYFLNLVAGNVFNTKKTPAIPAKYYLGLSTTNPVTATSEPSSGGYARIELTGLSTPVDGVVSNTAELRSNKATTNWGAITHYAIYDAPTGGNLLMHDALNRTRIVDIDTIMIFEVGSLKLSAKNPA